MRKKSSPHFQASGSRARGRAREVPRSRPPLARMLKIHELLARDIYPNCSTLAGHFEVSYKTIQRDIDFMRDQLELPIDYDQSRHGFHYTEPVAQFPLLTVSEGELVALLVAQKAVEQYRGTPFEKPLHRAFEKLASSLEASQRISLHELSEAVSFRLTGAPAAELKAFEKLAEAVLHGQVVEFDYRSLRASKPERRCVEPYHLACIDHQWYLIAHDLVRGARRTFALLRISRVVKLKRRFRRPADFSLSEMLAESFAAFEGRQAQRVRLLLKPLAARLVCERKWHRTQKLQPLDGGQAEMEICVGITPDLVKWIVGWGDWVEVLEPAALRAEVRQIHAAAAARYGN